MATEEDQDRTPALARVKRAVGHEVAEEGAPLTKRVVGPVKTAALSGAIATGVVGGGVLSYDGIAQFLSTHPHALLDFGPFAAVAVGTAGVTGIAQAITRTSRDGQYNPNGWHRNETTDARFHDAMRNVKVRAGTTAAAAAVATEGVHLLALGGTTWIDRGLAGVAVAAGGVAISAAIGARRVRPTRPAISE